MDFSKVFLERRSVRAYDGRPIPGEIKDKIVAATLRAPTAGNLMLYTILDIEDQALKERLAVTCDDQPFIARAPWVLIFLADYARMMAFFEKSGVGDTCLREGKPFLSPQESDLLLACCDALIAAQTAVCAAESLGLGSCYIGDVMENWEIHRDLLCLPRYTFPITMLCFGYPTEQQIHRPQPARPPRELVVREKPLRLAVGRRADVLVYRPGLRELRPSKRRRKRRPVPVCPQIRGRLQRRNAQERRLHAEGLALNSRRR